jgi:ribosomal protein S12 methylthiotransferase
MVEINLQFERTIMEKKLYLASLGCTKNLIDSEVMLSRLKDYHLTDEPAQADVIIVNSCGFIQSAKEESINTLLELHESRQDGSILVLAGCLSQRYKDELQDELIEVDIFTGVGDYDNIEKLIESKKSQFSDKVFLSSSADDRVVTGSNYHAYIKLSEGCNQTCSFCSIPSFKGKLNSREISDISDEVKHLVSKGFFDFTFVSQDSSSYLRDKDIPDGLERLIDEIEGISGVISARILYLYPSTTTTKLIEKIANSKLFHSYYDMPLQHINSQILKTMKRGKNQEKLMELLEAMKKVTRGFIRTTFIVGHPGESQDDFEELCEFVDEFGFDRVNVFSYSDEEGTAAFELDGKVDPEIIDDRADILGSIIFKNTILSMDKDVGKTFKVVIDGPSEEHDYILSARKLMWAPEIDGEIYINDSELDGDIVFGKIYDVKITELVGDKLLGTIVS